MSNELVIQSDQGMWNDKQLAALKSLGLAGASNAEMAVFLNYCQRTGLDPFARQIYMINRGGRWTIQASIDGFRVVAQRSGEYAGQTEPLWCGEDGVWKDVWLSSEPPTAAKVGVWRAGFQEPLYAVARLESYMPRKKDGSPMGLWSQMPDVMLSKCAETLALRKAFPNDLSGVYSGEEMEQADQPAPVPAARPVTVVVEDTTAEDEEAVRATMSMVAEAADKDALKVLWDASYSLLDKTVDGTTLRAAIVARVAELDREAADVAEVVADTEIKAQKEDK